MPRRLLLTIAALTLVAGCGQKDQTPPKAQVLADVPPPAGRQWTDVVAQTPEGGMRMGNPQAAVKIVEYASFSCPHCKRFEEEGVPPLRDQYIRSGKVSWEFRSFLIHGPDAFVTLLMNCRGPEPYFKLSEQLYAIQDTWLGKLVGVPAEEQQRQAKLPPVQQFKAMAASSGLYDWFRARGLPQAQADACLSDQKAIDKLTADQERATNQDQVNSTPTFFINGEQQGDVSTWAQLHPRLVDLTGS